MLEAALKPIDLFAILESLNKAGIEITTLKELAESLDKLAPELGKLDGGGMLLARMIVALSRDEIGDAQFGENAPCRTAVKQIHKIANSLGDMAQPLCIEFIQHENSNFSYLMAEQFPDIVKALGDQAVPQYLYLLKGGADENEDVAECALSVFGGVLKKLAKDSDKEQVLEAVEKCPLTGAQQMILDRFKKARRDKKLNAATAAGIIQRTVLDLSFG